MEKTINYISCYKKLPVPEEVAKEFPGILWEDMLFFTHDLNKFSLEELEITDDDKLFLNNKDGTIEKQDFTGEIVFSTMQFSEEHDYILYFKALFFKGELKELNLDKLIKKENTFRKTLEKANNESLLLYEDKKNKTWFKIYSFYYKCVRFVLILTRLVLGVLIDLTFKIERRVI